MSAAALDVFGVPNSLDTPIGAIGTEGAVEGRTTGMDGSGVFHADTVCSIRARSGRNFPEDSAKRGNSRRRVSRRVLPLARLAPR